MAQAGYQEREGCPRGAKLQVEIPVANTMMEVPEIFSLGTCPCASAGHQRRSEVINGASRIVPEPIARLPETHRKIALFPMRASFVILIHAAECQKQFATDRHISGHHERSLTFTGIIFAEMQQPTKLAREGLG